VAGNPLLNYCNESGNECAANNLRFWNAATHLMTDQRFYQPIARKRQSQVMINLFLSETAEYQISLEAECKKELMEALLQDLGMTKLMEASVKITGVRREALLFCWYFVMIPKRNIFFKASLSCFYLLVAGDSMGKFPAQR